MWTFKNATLQQQYQRYYQLMSSKLPQNVRIFKDEERRMHWKVRQTLLLIQDSLHTKDDLYTKVQKYAHV